MLNTEHWILKMGFFAGLNEEKYDRQYKDSDLAKRMVSFFTPQKGRMAAILALVLLIAGFGAALPVIVSAIMDLLDERPTVEAIALVGGGMSVIAVLNYGLNWLRRSLTVRAVGDVILDLRTRAFRASAEHDLSSLMSVRNCL
jgi:ATP-binding cassette, subfamily B, bacterial